MRKVVVFLILASAVVLVALAVALVREFSIHSLVAADAADLPTTAVVFTGQFDRVELVLSRRQNNETTKQSWFNLEHLVYRSHELHSEVIQTICETCKSCGSDKSQGETKPAARRNC